MLCKWQALVSCGTAAGVYKPTATSNRTSFVVADGIKLYGGFSGSETS